MITWSVCSGSTDARSRAAAIAIPPRSVASSDDRPPPSLPIGVRALLRITVVDMSARSQLLGDLEVCLGAGSDLFDGDAVLELDEGHPLGAVEVEHGEVGDQAVDDALA